MKFYKTEEAGYILGVGTESGGTEIPEAEYAEILTVIRSRPADTETVAYRLREDLTWEAYEIDPPDPDPDVDEVEALNILLGGAT